MVILIFKYWSLKYFCPQHYIFYLYLWYNNTYIDIQYWNYSQLRIQKNKDQVCVTFLGHTIFFSQKWNKVFPESEIVSYIDGLISELLASSVGCFMGSVYAGIFMFADDLKLLAPSVQALNIMLNICMSYAARFDVLFND